MIRTCGYKDTQEILNARAKIMSYRYKMLQPMNITITLSLRDETLN